MRLFGKVLTISALCLLLLSGCGSSEQPVSKSVPVNAVPVSLTTVKRGEIKEIRTYCGQVSSRGMLQLVAEVPGRILFITSEGKVEAGQTLVRIESEELDWQLEQAESALLMANLDLEMVTSGFRDEEIVIARAAVAAAEAALEGAKWAYDTAVKNFLDRPQLYAQVQPSPGRWDS